MPFHPSWPLSLPPHLVIEPVAWAVAAFALQRRPQDPTPEARSWIAVAALAGAVVGAKLVAWAMDPPALLTGGLAVWMGGKSVVGGLLGGWLGVEAAKRALRITTSTGDSYVPAIAWGIAVGRLACFWSGTEDGTHGAVTSAWWGLDAGDGLLRHPTALAEAVLAPLLLLIPAGPRPGDRFRRVLAAYLLWRLGVDAFKAHPFAWGGLAGTQVAALLGLAALAADARGWLGLRPEVAA